MFGFYGHAIASRSNLGGKDTRQTGIKDSIRAIWEFITNVKSRVMPMLSAGPRTKFSWARVIEINKSLTNNGNSNLTYP